MIGAPHFRNCTIIISYSTRMSRSKHDASCMLVAGCGVDLCCEKRFVTWSMFSSDAMDGANLCFLLRLSHNSNKHLLDARPMRGCILKTVRF